MKYTVEESLSNFKFWNGGKDRADNCSISELDSIEEFLEEIEPADGWTDTAINDIFWHDFDILAQHLGYEDEEDFDRKHDPYYVDDDELETYAEEWFKEFIEAHKNDTDLLKNMAEQLGCGQDDEDWEQYESEGGVADYLLRFYDQNEWCLMEYLFDEDDSGHDVSDEIPTTEDLRDYAMEKKRRECNPDKK